MPAYRHIFGPEPSRRFGRSLGVDLTPMKTCSFDCLFCQLGPMPQTTLASFSSRLGDDIAVDEDRLLDMLRRRPCTARQIADAFGLHLNGVAKSTGSLLQQRQIQTMRRGGEIFFEASEREQA